VGQSAVAPNSGANNAAANQQYQGSGIDMPLTGQNARNDGETVGGAGIAGSAAQQYTNPTGPATGNSTQATSQAPNLERWRFQRHDDLWWYYTPQRTWSVFQGNRWVSYQRGALYARDNLANATIAGTTNGQQVTAGRPDYLGTGMYSGAFNGQQATP